MSSTITQSSFGRTSEGLPIDCYILTNSTGLTAKIITYGGRLTELYTPDRKGDQANIVLGYDRLEQYLGPNPYFGATIGRVGNRIAGGKFTLDGIEYHLPCNNGPNTLHGGTMGFDRAVWAAHPFKSTDGAGLRLTYQSPDGEQGFPGNLFTTVTYTLADDSIANSGKLRIDYLAVTDKPTPVNLTNHSYFNLAGAGRGDILDHLVTIRASAYTPVDDTLIPTGDIAPVRGTPMDFNAPTAVGARISQVKGGYDLNYILPPPGGSSADSPAANMRDPKSGRFLEISTSQPGIQFYTGNFLDGSPGLGGPYIKHGALCLETQHFPDSVHHSNFPSSILRPGQTYRHHALYRFSAS